VLADNSAGFVPTAVVGLFMAITEEFIQLLSNGDRSVLMEDDNWCFTVIVFCIGRTEREHLADPEAKLWCPDSACVRLV
jgi:hypothetical protein